MRAAARSKSNGVIRQRKSDAVLRHELYGTVGLRRNDTVFSGSPGWIIRISTLRRVKRVSNR